MDQGRWSEAASWAGRLTTQRTELFGPHAKQTYLAREMQLDSILHLGYKGPMKSWKSTFT